MFWGLSEATDLFQEYLDSLKPKPECEAEQTEDEKNANTEKPLNTKMKTKEPENDDIIWPQTDCLNILLFGANDPRHLLKTMAKLYTHRDLKNARGEKLIMPQLNFYIIEGSMDIIARTIVLLSIALEHPESFSLRSKVHFFMDIYGNVLLRPASYQYLVAKSKTLLKMICDRDLLHKLVPMLCLDDLKYSELDQLENCLQFWQPKDGTVYDIKHCWIQRQRHMLATRFDHREGVFDWDLSMILKDRGAKQICSQEYRHWRETGVAFTFPEYEQCKPNKTLVAGLKRNGDSIQHRGYVGDMETGPFCTFGLRTSDNSMMNSAHGENDYRATDITERNLLELLHELQKQTPYEHNSTLSRKYGSIRLLMGKQHTCNEADLTNIGDFDKKWIDVEGVSVRFISTNDIFTLQKKDGPYMNHFDVVFVGQTYFPFMKDSFVDTLRENALLILETKMLTVQRKTDIADFETKLKSYAKSMELTSAINYDVINALHASLKFKKVTKKINDESTKLNDESTKLNDESKPEETPCT